MLGEGMNTKLKVDFMTALDESGTATGKFPLGNSPRFAFVSRVQNRVRPCRPQGDRLIQNGNRMPRFWTSSISKLDSLSQVSKLESIVKL